MPHLKLQHVPGKGHIVCDILLRWKLIFVPVFVWHFCNTTPEWRIWSWKVGGNLNWKLCGGTSCANRASCDVVVSQKEDAGSSRSPLEDAWLHIGHVIPTAVHSTRPWKH